MGNLKLPHWISLVVSLAAAIVAWLMAKSASGDIVLPAVALGALPLVNSILGMISSSVSPAANLRAAKRAGLALGTMCFLFCLAACQGCTKQQQQAGATLGIDTAVCVLQHSTLPPLQIAETCIGATGPDAVAFVSSVLAAHHAAEQRERADGGPVTIDMRPVMRDGQIVFERAPARVPFDDRPTLRDSMTADGSGAVRVISGDYP